MTNNTAFQKYTFFHQIILLPTWKFKLLFLWGNLFAVLLVRKAWILKLIYLCQKYLHGFIAYIKVDNGSCSEKSVSRIYITCKFEWSILNVWMLSRNILSVKVWNKNHSHGLGQGTKLCHQIALAARWQHMEIYHVFQILHTFYFKNW